MGFECKYSNLRLNGKFVFRHGKLPSRAVDFDPAAAAHDLRPAVAEGFHGLAAGKAQPGAARRVDVVPRRTQQHGGQPLGEVEAAVVKRRNDRPLRRAVERFIEDPLAEELLRGTFEKAKKVRVELDQQKILFFPEK